MSIVHNASTSGTEWVAVQCDECCVLGDGGENEGPKRFRVNAHFTLLYLEVQNRQSLNALLEALRNKLDGFKPSAWVGGFKINRAVTKDDYAICDALVYTQLHATLHALAAIPSQVLPGKRAWRRPCYHLSLQDVGLPANDWRALPGHAEDVDPQYVHVPNAHRSRE